MFGHFKFAAFAGYFGVLNSNNYTADIPKHPEVLFFVVCIGLITSLAWALINQGSKVWQRHWEIHVDMLEEKITGPLYKIATTSKTFSVSKINDLVSRFFVFIWALLSIKYFTDHLTLNPIDNNGFNWLIFISIIVTLYFIGTMFFGYGRGRFGERKVKFFKRNFSTKDL
ncbi:RipA family octameric membrane protein [Flavobacterium piscinae]